MNKTKNNKTKVRITLILFLVMLLPVNSLQADNKIGSPRAKERINMLKKLKMIEAMELDEAKSEKFFAKFNTHSKQLEDKRIEQRELTKKLNDATKNNSKEISALTEQLLKTHEEFNQMNSEKNKDLRTVLSEMEFAKYLVFESRFTHEMFSCFMKHNHHNDMKGKSKKNIDRKKGKRSHKEMNE